ncbi:5472_t:CDS:2 [Acaulospora morrowiae]|uniref:5472_t:CDS:1 n=1 Tax=Acaulospora morrowiae TaxID=94023 RepID=A0A9N9CEY1_9GLOM|nr:5472_t:CDS:2 [Acaulospora morrowiae]
MVIIIDFENFLRGIMIPAKFAWKSQVISEKTIIIQQRSKGPRHRSKISEQISGTYFILTKTGASSDPPVNPRDKRTFDLH